MIFLCNMTLYILFTHFQWLFVPKTSVSFFVFLTFEEMNECGINLSLYKRKNGSTEL